MSSRTPLEPCPFCGSSNIKNGDGGMPTWAQCPDCGAEGPSARSWGQAVLWWNRRTRDARIAELEAALAFYAARKNYDVPRDRPAVLSDDGERARKALEGK